MIGGREGTSLSKRHLKVIYIRPSRYDDEGYVLRFWRGVLPSNTLACLDALTQSVAQSGVLGADVSVDVDVYDDTVQRVPVKKIARLLKQPDTQVVVGLVGVQSNQFERASDLAIEFRNAGVQVMIGGFHVSGMLSLFDKPSRDLQRLLDRGVSLVKGEAEAPGAMARILTDALNGTMKPIYDILDFPDLTNAPVPLVADKLQHKFFTKNMATIDTSRGCPFNCSFCTIINVQGRKMRYRSASCVLKAIEENYARGIRIYFFTDDNFSRNPVWEQILDGLIVMRERGLDIIFMMQIDTIAHRIPNFAEKAAKAGCYLAFVGMESVNAKNLESVGKRQNNVDDYASMVALWHKHNVLVHVGYIIGFPNDTRESIGQDMVVLRDQVKVDMASFFMMTPLPGSKDHWKMVQDCVPLDADLNNYDSQHETFKHALMAPGEWRAAYNDAMVALYNKQSIINSMLLMQPEHRRHMFFVYIWYRYCALEGLHPMSTGMYRYKDRLSRRPIFPKENILQYAWRRTKDAVHGFKRYAGLFIDFQEIWMLTRAPDDPRWATLAELRQKWVAAQQRISESRLKGHYDDAARELKAILDASANKLRQLSQSGSDLNFRARRKLAKKAQEVEAYLRSSDLQGSWNKVVEAERYLSERIVAGYEEAAIKYVARRRAVNEYRKRLLARLKQGRVRPSDLARLPYALVVEVVCACRFCLSLLMLHK